MRFLLSDKVSTLLGNTADYFSHTVKRLNPVTERKKRLNRNGHKYHKYAKHHSVSVDN